MNGFFPCIYKKLGERGVVVQVEKEKLFDVEIEWIEMHERITSILSSAAEKNPLRQNAKLLL